MTDDFEVYSEEIQLGADSFLGYCQCGIGSGCGGSGSGGCQCGIGTGCGGSGG